MWLPNLASKASMKDGDPVSIALHEVSSAASTPPNSISSNYARERSLKSAYRKSDLRILAFYSLVLVFLHLEGHAPANAAIMNVESHGDIKHQLGNITSTQWAWTLSIGCYALLLVEPFSTFLLKIFGPRTWMSRIMVSWGIVTVCHSAVQNVAGLLACRFFMGLCAAGFVPGVLFHLSFWYPPQRLPFRIAIFFVSGVFSGSFAGLLAYAISFLNGKAGLAGWRWLFILEGVPAILCGIWAFFFLPSYPQDASFLTEDERTSVLAILPDVQAEGDESKKFICWAEVKPLLRDPTNYSFLLLWAAHSIGSKGVEFVLPSVIFNLGLAGSTKTQLLTMPGPFLASTVLLLLAYLIRWDKVKPYPSALILECLAIACYAVIAFAVNEKPIAKYIVLTLATTCTVGVLPILWTERIRVASERFGTSGVALVIGATASMAAMAHLVGPHVYQQKYEPTYRVSFQVSVGLLALAAFLIAATWGWTWRTEERACCEGGGDEVEKGVKKDCEEERMDSGT